VSTFPHARRSRPGYDVAEVEEFLRRARSAYDGGTGTLTSEEIRHIAFGMHRGGYETAPVDAAMERLEDAFASRERDAARARLGEDRWHEQARESAREVVARLERPARQRFRRTSILTVGYRIAEVDAFGERLLRYFREGTPVGVQEVRGAVFLPQRGGYSETQVDLLLDTVTEVMLAVR
jgi:DivIVA domain-containing protein